MYLHCHPDELASAIGLVNEDINSILAWADINGLIFNADKTQAIIFGTSRYTNNIDLTSLPTVTMANSVIQYSTHVKYLGVIIANNLSWDKQVTTTTNKIRTVLYRLKLCSHLIPEVLKSRLVATLILPYVDYCCVVFTDITAELNLKIQRAVNACIRFVFHVRRDAHITPYFNKLRWLKVDTRRMYFVGSLLYNILMTQRPARLHVLFTYRAQISSRTTRVSSDILSLPQCRTELYRRSFSYTAAKFWNNLPSDVRDAPSSANFRCKLYAHLLDRFALSRET